MQLKPINQQVVSVVGASSGIGRITALEFARRGAKVVVSARSESKLKSLVEEIRGFGGEATFYVADVEVFEQVKAIADKTVEVYGRLDTWVHVAAIGIFATFDNTTPEASPVGCDRCYISISIPSRSSIQKGRRNRPVRKFAIKFLQGFEINPCRLFGKVAIRF